MDPEVGQDDGTLHQQLQECEVIIQQLMNDFSSYDPHGFADSMNHGILNPRQLWPMGSDPVPTIPPSVSSVAIASPDIQDEVLGEDDTTVHITNPTISVTHSNDFFPHISIQSQVSTEELVDIMSTLINDVFNSNKEKQMLMMAYFQ